MYAVVRSGGSQYRVSEGDRVRVQKLGVPAGQAVTLDQVLLLGDGDRILVGEPLVVGAQVRAEVVSEGRESKIRIWKLLRRKHHLKRQGHRQPYTELRITGIEWPGGDNDGA